MTKFAWLFLTLALATSVLGLNLTTTDAKSTAFIASGVFAGLFVLAAFVGRRIKFDPMLR